MSCFHRIVAFAFVCGVLTSFYVPLVAADRPNVVLIISDDQTYSDFGFMGNRHVRTPHLDRLASQSARYTNGYVPSSVCRPSLVTLLTGLYPHQHGVHFNHPPPGFAELTRSPEIDKKRYDALRDRATALIRSTPTLPRLLADHGYRCLQTGKYWEGHWRNAGFTEGMTVAEPSDVPNALGNKRLAGGDVVAHGNGDQGLIIGRKTMRPIFDFVDDCQMKENPFFVWYAPFMPHLPHDAPRRFSEAYEENERVPKHAIPYYAACTWFDETVGQLIDHIEKRGLAKQTLFVFVVDNGFTPDPERPMTGGDFNYTKTSKRSPFDDGLRTPILIRWDGHTKSATNASPCSSVDIMPTILDATGVDNSAIELPGRSLWPSATGSEILQDQPVFGEVYPGDATSLGNPSRDIAYRWIRDGQYKLIVAHSRSDRKPWGRYVDNTAMFDMKADPRELRNLAKDIKHAEIVNRLKDQLDRWWTPAAGTR